MTPIAWIIPGDGNARDDGSLDAMAWKHGEFTLPVYAVSSAHMKHAYDAARLAYDTPVRDDGSSLNSLVSKDFREDVLAAIENAISAERAIGWRPIDDEAKAAGEILAYSKEGGTGVMIMNWIAPIDFLTEAEIEAWSDEGMSNEELERPDWFYAGIMGGGRLSEDCYPSHWMPLPGEPSPLYSAEAA